MRNATEAHIPADLGELERRVMEIVWREGPCTAEQVREKLDRPLRESTVRTVLRRIEEKGFVTHTVESRTYVYKAAEARQRVAARAVKGIVDWFCNGSMEELLTGMVDAAVLDRRELQRLAEKIAKAKGGRK
jgi:BlaI family penicillinase repressor